MVILNPKTKKPMPVEDNTPSKTVPNSATQGVQSLSPFNTFEVSCWIPGSDAVSSSLYPTFYVANVKCFLIEARLRYTAASTSGTLDINKVVNGDDTQGAGNLMIAAQFDMSDTAHQIYLQGATTSLAGAQLNPGDAMALVAGGDLTSQAGVSITVLMGINKKDVPTGQSVTTIISGT